MRIAVPSLIVAAPFLLTLSACSGEGRTGPDARGRRLDIYATLKATWAHAGAALFILVLFLGASPALAQDVIEPNKPFTVVADHDGVGVDGFHLIINGAVAATKTAAEVGCASTPCTVAFPVPAGLATGTYTYTIDAFNATGATATKVRTLTVTTLPAPMPPIAPTNLRIIRQDVEPKPQQQEIERSPMASRLLDGGRVSISGRDRVAGRHSERVPVEIGHLAHPHSQATH